jgi:acetylornithine deacetylase
MIDLLKKLIAIPRPSRGEDAGADFLEGYMRGIGLDVKRKGNNLWVESEPESSKPTILLNAHLDTVKPASGYTRDPYTASEEDGVIYGLGSNDCGGALVSLLQVYRQLTLKPQPYRLIYSVTAEEEVGGVNGIEAIIPLLGKVDLGVIGEPTGMQMAVAEKGLLVFDCLSSGVSGHAAREEGVNAIYRAIEDIQWFKDYSFPMVSPYLGPVKMTVTMISAGTQHNVVPDGCKFVVDVRPNGLYTNQEILDTVRANVKCSVEPRSMRHKSSHIADDNPVVVRGRSLGLESYGSPTTSSQTLVDFPSLKIGPGESSRSHRADEFIKISEIEGGADTYVKLLDNLQI